MSYEEVLKVFDPPVLEFKAGKRSIDPVHAFAIQGCEPLKAPSIDKPPHIHVLIPSRLEESKNVMNVLNDLRNGKMTGRFPRSKYKPFGEVYGFDLEIEEPDMYDDLSDIYRKTTQISGRSKGLDVVVIVSPSRSELGGFYYKIKVASIQKGVQTQVILQKTIDNYMRQKTEEEKGDLLWNFSLSVFSKLGGIPWKLQEMLGGVSAFISLNTVSSYEQELGITSRGGVVALEVANSWGDPIGRFFATGVRVKREEEEEGIAVDLGSVNTLVKNALDEIEEKLIDPERSKTDDYIIVHVKDRYAESVHDEIQKAIASKGFKKHKIIHVQEEGGLRLYDPFQKITRAWPQEGSYWYLEDGGIAFLFTLGKWQYSVPATTEPYVIEARNVSPIQVNFVKGSKGTRLTDKDLNHIYHLTRLHYYSADVPRIKMPSTIRLGQRAAHLAASGLTNSDFDVSFLY